MKSTLLQKLRQIYFFLKIEGVKKDRKLDFRQKFRQVDARSGLLCYNVSTISRIFVKFWDLKLCLTYN